MAIVYTGTWSAFTQEQFDDIFSHSDGKLKELHVVWEAYHGLNVGGWIFYLGDSPVAGYAVSDNNYAAGVTVKGDWYGAYARYFNMQQARFVATGKAISMTSITNEGLSRIGVIITLDSKGDICTIVSKDAQDIRNTPYVVSSDPLYPASPAMYAGNTSTSFGQITLERIPAPWQFTEEHRELEDVYYASTNMEIADGPVIHDSEKFYCIGGGLMLRDYL